ncbi:MULTISPECIES: hypothetical protein [Klebsiella]|uniref:hypothetical protein n=1 Tax=Klebsiella TaxID=570 RepID=UPI00142D9A19|nr:MULTISPECIES: hypothetical protein [Klebsiella]MCJ1827089.1 hypothetical protein [Klebsiella quasivariicola]MEA1149741.1 hypothetical protein [Klebsiella pneumoniae]
MINILLLQDFIVPFLFSKSTAKTGFLVTTARVIAATHEGRQIVAINNDEKYEQYITPRFCAFAQTSTLTCNNVRPVVYPPSKGWARGSGISWKPGVKHQQGRSALAACK